MCYVVDLLGIPQREIVFEGLNVRNGAAKKNSF
jgi:hypothetical protein